MKPIELVNFDGDSSPNTPVYLISEAMNKDLRLFGENGEYTILGYYYSEKRKCMVLDIEKKE